MPHSQIKSFYSGMEIDEERKPQKDKKKEGDKKKKQDKKNAEPPKPKPPKTIEGALEAVSIIQLHEKTSFTITKNFYPKIKS